MPVSAGNVQVKWFRGVNLAWGNDATSCLDYEYGYQGGFQ